MTVKQRRMWTSKMRLSHMVWVGQVCSTPNESKQDGAESMKRKTLPPHLLKTRRIFQLEPGCVADLHSGFQKGARSGGAFPPSRNSHDMFLFNRQTYVRWVLSCRGRWYSQETRKYNILFMGRDEFSCGVFRELCAAGGVSSFPSQYLISY